LRKCKDHIAVLDPVKVNCLIVLQPFSIEDQVGLQLRETLLQMADRAGAIRLDLLDAENGNGKEDNDFLIRCFGGVSDGKHAEVRRWEFSQNILGIAITTEERYTQNSEDRL
jgi:hypothetical protein